ncbi:glycosyltransferase [Kiritimatiella glycovorans]|uniref:Glycosyl transferase, group 1 family protein n=1 Tax=Kiritimatiella glycovorans TaxID=1307763 RepID=A0A0G3EG99_9BACT|nr:glycosyltransferase [Kiritimatiella glycovorans]AKJ65491.1 Glycosyl transferase, group 1 family protein [Kiritimatiella glycovorans]
MRICMFTDSFLPRVSGVSFAVINQANELVKRGHEVTIFRPRPMKDAGGDALNEMHPEARIHDLPISIPTRKFPDLNIAVPSFFPAYQTVREFRPELIHVHTEWGCGWEGLLQSRIRNVPVIGTFHTFYAEPGYLRHFYMPDTRLTKEMMWKYSITFFNRCNAVISPSRTVKRFLMLKGLKWEPTVISNGIREPELRADEEIAALREQYGIRDTFNFIYIGRVSGEKSLDVAVEAFRQVYLKHKHARFVIVGDGSANRELDRLIPRAGIESAVVRVGRVTHDRLIADNIPRLGDAFITASKTENQPVSLLEAMAFGLPIIGPRSRGIPELVEHGVNGYLFRPDDAGRMAGLMNALVEDRALMDSMRQGAAEKVRPHAISNVAERLETIYRNAIDTADASGRTAAK